MNIRALLILLVGAVWLPAVVGFGFWHEPPTSAESEAARNDVRRLADNVNLQVERELDKRLVMAHTLAGSGALARRDFGLFHGEAVP